MDILKNEFSRLNLMFNKNGGTRESFYRATLLLLFLFTAQTSLLQSCLQYEGEDCTQCAAGFDLVSGGCVSRVSATANPILIFRDIPGVQKVLYSVSPVLLTRSDGVAQAEGNVVSEFQVVKVDNATVGSYYEVRVNTTTSVTDLNELLDRSSLLKEASQTQQNVAKSDTPQDPPETSLAKQAVASLNETVGQRSTAQIDSELNLTNIKQTQPIDFTLIKESVPASPTLVKVTIQSQPSNNATQEEATLNFTQINELTEQQNLTQINMNSGQKTEDPGVTSSNQNNSELLLQLQQINQRLSQIGQNVTLKQVKQNQPEATPLDLTQVTQRQASTDGGAITLQLTRANQFTQINQQLTQAKLTQSTDGNATLSENSIESSPSLPSQVQVLANLTKAALSLSQEQVPPSPPQEVQQQSLEVNFTAIKQIIDVNWIKATRYELYNLTLVSQALIQAKLKQLTIASPGSLLTFKCGINLTLFLPPSTQSTAPEEQFTNYVKTMYASIRNQLKGFTEADRSTLCFDPPFHKSFQHLNDLHPNLSVLPLFTAYYQYCGFAKTYRIFYLDDSALPALSIYQGEIIVDLFRMSPVEVFFTTYSSTKLQL